METPHGADVAESTPGGSGPRRFSLRRWSGQHRSYRLADLGDRLREPMRQPILGPVEWPDIEKPLGTTGFDVVV